VHRKFDDAAANVCCTVAFVGSVGVTFDELAGKTPYLRPVLIRPLVAAGVVAAVAG